jgi:hypothetical protein
LIQHSIRQSSALIAAAALALASIPFGAARADDTKVTQAPGNAQELGVMAVNLKDAVKFNYGFQGALQGAGTPNQAGLGAFIPLKFSKNSVAFVDVLVNANFNDYGNYSSIGDTTVAGTTFSTSTRLGYRWLNSDRSWMYGVNAGYDSRPMATGATDNGVPVTNSQTVFFQQVALNAEAKSNKWSASAYGLIPVGEYGLGSSKIAFINSDYGAEPLTTIGLDLGYTIAPALTLAVGYYYQACEKEPPYYLSGADGSGVKARLAYDITNQLQAGVVYSYDDNFKSRVTGDLKFRFGSGGKNQKSQPPISPLIQALQATPANRDVRVANSTLSVEQLVRVYLGGGQSRERAWDLLKQFSGNQIRAKAGTAIYNQLVAQGFFTRLY